MNRYPEFNDIRWMPAPSHNLSSQQTTSSSVMEEEKERPHQSVWLSLEDRWQRTRDHFHSYPYVWGSYIFVFGGLGLYTAHRWRALRRAEDELLRFQERLKQTMTAREVAEATVEAQGRGSTSQI